MAKRIYQARLDMGCQACSLEAGDVGRCVCVCVAVRLPGDEMWPSVHAGQCCWFGCARKGKSKRIFYRRYSGMRKMICPR